MALRKILEPEREAVTGGKRRLRNEELHDLCSGTNIVGVVKWRRMRWAWHVAHVWEKRNAYRVLMGKPE